MSATHQTAEHAVGPASLSPWHIFVDIKVLVRDTAASMNAGKYIFFICWFGAHGIMTIDIQQTTRVVRVTLSWSTAGLEWTFKQSLVSGESEAIVHNNYNYAAALGKSVVTEKEWG